MSEREQFDAKIALEYAASMARPRLVGTAEHEQVAADLAARLEQWGYRVERERFEFSTVLNALLALVLWVNSVCLMAMVVLRQTLPYAPQLGALIILAGFALAGVMGRSISADAVAAPKAMWRKRLAYRMGKRYAASNLVAIWPQDDRPRRTLYLVAHYDSKSQRWPLVLRIALYTLLIPGTLWAIGAALLNQASALSDGLGMGAAVASLMLVLLGTGNASPGAIDNASGVGTVLHLAEILAARSDWRERLRVIVLLPSAEEVGLMGTTAYVKRHAARLQQENALVLNFDGVGVEGQLQWVGATSSELARLIQDVARTEHISIGRFRFIGALFDHIPFAQRGLDGVSLITVGRASRSIHTPNDTIDHLHESGFDQAGRVALRVIRQLVDR
ncbi:MAG: M28 family peptidase [Thermoflexales bacterium]|nr:M28 family peptidase [Thermoflexales bacterium]